MRAWILRMPCWSTIIKDFKTTKIAVSKSTYSPLQIQTSWTSRGGASVAMYVRGSTLIDSQTSSHAGTTALGSDPSTSISKTTCQSLSRSPQLIWATVLSVLTNLNPMRSFPIRLEHPSTPQRPIPSSKNYFLTFSSRIRTYRKRILAVPPILRQALDQLTKGNLLKERWTPSAGKKAKGVNIWTTLTDLECKACKHWTCQRSSSPNRSPRKLMIRRLSTRRSWGRLCTSKSSNIDASETKMARLSNSRSSSL